MEYAGFLRGEMENMPWDDVLPLTEDAIIGTQTPSAQVQDNEAPVEAAAGGGRGCSYKLEEDLLLVAAWLNVSLDPVVGSNQSLGAFWHRIESYYNESKTFTSTRNKKSLQGRWTFINTTVQKFCGHYARALRTKKSGTTEAETVVEACKMFQAVEHKEFTLLPCWRELRNHPKWQAESARKKQKTAPSGSPCSTQHGGSSAGMNIPEKVGEHPSTCSPRAKRPPGRTRSKDGARGMSSSSSASAPMTDLVDRQLAMKEMIEKERAKRFAELMEVERKKLRLEEERMQMQREKEERDIMNMDISHMDEDQQAYYKSLRQSIIAARRASSGPSA
ncbi:glutathione S-transferase T3-like [Phragmites australis]|nr:glutathione S-transferase T3-like [Phragmites australis]